MSQENLKNENNSTATVEEFSLIPYAEENIPDSVFHWFWNQMVEERLDKVVFYAGGVKNPYDFIVLMKYNVLPTFVINSDSKPVALAWLSDFGNRKAFAHFCVLKRAWGKSKEIGLKVLEFWLNELDLNVVLGMTPTRNRMAIAFIKKLGMKVLGDIPMAISYRGNYESATISYITKEELKHGRQNT